ncbi:hypothetical protein Hsw_PA0199 (plasmid) [Hymenobacter swuensis DY53]|uniref:Helicase/UvrB N-terminal domain-containing protein n=2 Tax=Hymenobacter TaxID=89966 RepID=W8EUW9_9BACT|nr:hypothetical protein Hsw_PA0199 [Hymenobacter swuensis DY53]
MLGLFNYSKFEELAALLKDTPEGLDENNVSRFHVALTAGLLNTTQLPTSLLLEYDGRIVAHTAQLNEQRLRRGEEPIRWKYFQYLTLLFTEIYLDRYFADPEALRAALNAELTKWAAALPRDAAPADKLPLFEETDAAARQLNKLAFSNATGSGKTLLMHVHIAQYRWYLTERGAGLRTLNRIILLTPNEGLSVQHLREFQAAGIEAELFSGQARGLFAGKAVEIIDINKLRDSKGQKTVDVASFLGNNLVLVDEGHRGASGGADSTWLEYRRQLSEEGFSFEYSATFVQAVKADVTLTSTYARAILFDYSYKYFYGDGFGKDYQILNLPNDKDAEWLHTYLVAGLMAFYQQQYVWAEQGPALRPYNLEKPLWIFVGGSVTASLNREEASDMVRILLFLSQYVSRREDSIRRIHQILHQGLLNSQGEDLLSNRFPALLASKLTAEQLFDDSLLRIFNAPSVGRLTVENLRGITGEIALRLGDNPPFGVINVGSDAALVALCSIAGLDTSEQEFSDSLFQQLNAPESNVNLLMGSRKFTEGWSSWRVSTMGLLNIGQGEGAQIIQLFGRGVRLKGYKMGLKRSAAIRPVLHEQGLTPPTHLPLLETLNIFGVRATYMTKFQEYLEEEGMPKPGTQISLVVPVRTNLPAGRSLFTLRLKREIEGKRTDFGVAFRALGPVPRLGPPAAAIATAVPGLLTKNRIILNWYPKLMGLRSKGLGEASEAILETGHLTARHTAFLDLDRLFFELTRYKAERGWSNLHLPAAAELGTLLADTSWYELKIPKEELAFDAKRSDDFGRRLRRWQEIASALLRSYTERYYLLHKRAWEEPFLEYQPLKEDDPNLLAAAATAGQAATNGYRVQVDEKEKEANDWFTELRDSVKADVFKKDKDPHRSLHALHFIQHLYQPLLALDSRPKLADVTPVALNKGEREFVEDLRHYHQQHPEFFADKELYLLRNLSRGRGIGFFEAGNFYPDFLLWLQIGPVQHLVFVDPKGLRNLKLNDPKLSFYQTIKEIESRPALQTANPNLHLHAFLVTATRLTELEHLGTATPTELAERHILLQEECKDTYIETMLNQVLT